MTQGRPGRLQFFYKQEAGDVGQGWGGGGAGLSREDPIGFCLVTLWPELLAPPSLFGSSSTHLQAHLSLPGSRPHAADPTPAALFPGMLSPVPLPSLPRQCSLLNLRGVTCPDPNPTGWWATVPCTQTTLDARVGLEKHAAPPQHGTFLGHRCSWHITEAQRLFVQ